MPRDWDAATYDRLPIPMTAWGETVLGWLDLRGDERVLDAGCGTGKVTEMLRDRLPHGSVVALDGSVSMVEQARVRLGEGRVEYLVADLEEPLPVSPPVDAILSTATFHWIADHDALFARLRAHLRDGGHFVAQCGGRGNIASVHAAARETLAVEPFAAHFAGWQGPWNFATPEETERRLQRAGFAEARAWLQPRPVTPDDPHAYLTEINLGAHLGRLPEELKRPFVDDVLDRLGGAPITIDYVRLNIDATA